MSSRFEATSAHHKETIGEVVEVGSEVKDFKPGDRVLIAAITPDWNSLEAQGGYAMHSGGMLSGWKFSNFKDGVFGEYFHVNDADGNLAHLPEGMDIAAACMLAEFRQLRPLYKNQRNDALGRLFSLVEVVNACTAHSRRFDFFLIEDLQEVLTFHFIVV